MTIEKTICDECGRVKAEANHWHKVGVTTAGQVGVQVGYLYGPPHDSLAITPDFSCRQYAMDRDHLESRTL